MRARTYRVAWFCLPLLASGGWLPGAAAKDVAYRVVIDAPSGLKTLLEDNLSLIRWEGSSGKKGEVDEDQLRRLFDQGKDEIERLVATEGYYSPTVDADLAPDGDRWVAHYRITPNEVTRVEKVDLSFVGPIAQAPAGQPPDLDELREDWSLNQQDVFRQADWEAAKRRLLQGLLLQTYPFATITRSEAQVDVTTNRVKLTVVVASGPAVRFGPVQITGLKRYPDLTVTNLNPIKIGELYSQKQIFEFQKRLNNTGFFSRVDVSIDAVADPGTDPNSPFVPPKPDGAEGIDAPAKADAPPSPIPREVLLPLRVSVDENTSKQLSLGVGLSSNSGPRGTAGYNVINFLGGAKQLRTTLSVDRLRQTAGADLLFPQTPTGSRYSLSTYVRREDVQNETTRGFGLSGRRAWGPEATERYSTIDYVYEQKYVDEVPQTGTQILGATNGVTLRRVDNLLTPTIGYFATGQVGAGVRLATGQPYARIYGKGLRFWPIGERNTLIARLEAGAIAGAHTETIPSTLLFRAGGDGSVRGYGYQSLGVQQAGAIVGGRYLATATLEGIHWLGPRWPAWGVALFVDAGNAGNKLADLKPVYGYGTGVRWRSPVGVLDFDVARGVENGTIRLHFSLGVSF